MVTRYSLGTKKKAAAFRAVFKTNGFRYDEQCEVLSNNIAKSMDNCLTLARKEVGYSDKRMDGAKEMCFECPEVIDFECRKEKSGRITAIVRWVTAFADRENQTPISHENGRKFSVAMCEYVKQYIKDANEGKAPKWLSRIDLKTEGFTL